MNTYTVDCGGLTAPQLHTALATALDFPDWYGRNLDALYDLLTETSGQLQLVDFDKEAFPGFLSVFEDAAQDNPELTVIFTEKE